MTKPAIFPQTAPGTIAVQVTRDDPRITVYQVLVLTAAPAAACVVTCDHLPDGEQWRGACHQWRAWGTCPHVELAQQWQRQGRPTTTPISPLVALRQQRQVVKQLLPQPHGKPGRRKWRPTIVKTEDRPLKQAGEEERTVPPGLERERAERPGQKPPGHQRWREFNQQTATKYKVEMPGHHCPQGWHTDPDGKCRPKEQRHIEQAQQRATAQPDDVAAQHDLALAHLAGGQIESSQPLDPSQSGVNTAHIVKLKGNGTVLYKSAAGAAAHMHPDDLARYRELAPQARYEIEHGLANQHRREALFYDLERRYFGTGLTPPTTLRQDSEGHEGSLQQFVPHARTVKSIPEAELKQLVATDPCLKRSLEDLTALDLFGGHQDRRPPNGLIQADPAGKCHKVVAIDNGFSSGPPILGGHSHFGYDLGVNQLRSRHLEAAQRAVDAGVEPLIHRAKAVGLHPNVGRQHYLNALFMTRQLKDHPFKREELGQQYLEFLDHTSHDDQLPREAREAAAEALAGGLKPYDRKQANDVVGGWEREAAELAAAQRALQEKRRSDEENLDFSKRIERELREQRKPKPSPPAAYEGHEALAPTQLVTPAAVVTAAAGSIVVAIKHVGSQESLAQFTLDAQGKLTVDNQRFTSELHQAPYHFSGAGKLWAIVQHNAHNSYQYVTFTRGTLEQLHERVPVAERYTVPPAIHGLLDFEAQRQAYLRRKQGN